MDGWPEIHKLLSLLMSHSNSSCQARGGGGGGGGGGGPLQLHPLLHSPRGQASAHPLVQGQGQAPHLQVHCILYCVRGVGVVQKTYS